MFKWPEKTYCALWYVLLTFRLSKFTNGIVCTVSSPDSQQKLFRSFASISISYRAFFNFAYTILSTGVPVNDGASLCRLPTCPDCNA